MNSLALKTKKFTPLGLKGKWLLFLGNITIEPFSMLLYSKPGGGKSTFAIMLAYYLANDLNKKVCYIASEEGPGATLQEKFKRKRCFHKNIDIYDNKNSIDFKKHGFVIMDSVTDMGYSPGQLKNIQAKSFPYGISLIYILHSTKSGSFRGENTYAHLVDINIKIENGIAFNEKNRYGGEGRFIIY